MIFYSYGMLLQTRTEHEHKSCVLSSLGLLIWTNKTYGTLKLISKQTNIIQYEKDFIFDKKSVGYLFIYYMNLFLLILRQEIQLPKSRCKKYVLIMYILVYI
jgi:hypothetical protein